MQQTKDIFPKINRGFSNMKKMHRLEDNKLELQIYSNPSPESQTYTGFCQREAGVVKRAPGSPVGLRRFSTPPQPRPHHPAGGLLHPSSVDTRGRPSSQPHSVRTALCQVRMMLWPRPPVFTSHLCLYDPGRDFPSLCLSFLMT